MSRAALAGCLQQVRRADAAWEAELRFPAGLPVFAGHFPGRPLVPGVYLLEGARQLAEAALARALRLRAVEEARFTGEVGPDEAVDLALTLEDAPDGWRGRATLSKQGRGVASFRLLLGEGA